MANTRGNYPEIMNARPQLSREGPNVDQIKLIGIELAVRKDGNGEVELAMHGMEHTIDYPPYDRDGRVRVTVHTSNGDITSTFPLRVGNHQSW